MNLGVYCETIAPSKLATPEILGLLGKYEVTLGHALCFEESKESFPADKVNAHLELATHLREAGGKYCLWPLLPKTDGYWVNERNMDRVDRMTDRLLEGFNACGVKPDWIVMDIETPWWQLAPVMFPGYSPIQKFRSLLGFVFGNRRPKRFARAATRLQKIVTRIQSENIRVSSAVFPLLIADLVNEGCALQDYLEMPVFPVKFDAYNSMFYNSYMPAAMPFLIPPSGAQRFLFEYAKVLTSRFDQGGWVTFGSTWEGVIPGNEGKTYTDAAQLAPDVAAAKAAGVETLWLYCLEGILFCDQGLKDPRSPEEAEAFFRVLTETAPKEPKENPRWSRGRKVLEIIFTDRLASRYDWEQ